MQLFNTEYLKLTQNLVSIPSFSTDLEALMKIVDFCATYFSHHPVLKVKKFVNNGKPSLVIGSNLSKNPRIAMIGHLDTVPASPELFTVRQNGSLLYGRGVCDMKGSVAIMMELLYKIVEKNPSFSIALWLTTDEEVGGINGTHYLVDNLQYRPSVALVPDGGNGPETIVLKSKGLLPLTMHAHGTASHASRPWEGQNAIEKLIITYQKLKELFPHDPAKIHSIKEMDDRWYSTAVMTTIKGGEATNVVPNDAESVVAVRLAEDVDINALQLEISKISKSTDVSINILGVSPVSVTKYNDPYVQLYQKIVTEEIGKQTNFISYSGTNDSRFLTKYGIPTIVSRPRGGGQHSNNEWVDVDSMKDFYQIYSQFIIKAQHL